MAIPLRMTEADAQEWILRSLGAPQFKVELSQPDLDMHIADAKRWFSSHRSIVREHTIQLGGGTQEFPLPDDADVVVEVLWPGSRSQSLAGAIGEAAGTWLLPDGGIPSTMFHGGFNLAGFVQSRQYLDTTMKITGAAPEWEQPDIRTLRVFTPDSLVGPCIIRYKSSVCAFSDLATRDLDLVCRYALASAKKKLGRLRSRFDGAVTSQGSTGQDGATLLQEGTEEIESLQDLIQRSAGALPIVIG